MRAAARILIGALLLTTIAAAAGAQQPRIANTTIAAQPAPTPFVAGFRSLVSSIADVAYIGYSVPVVDSERVMCCFQSGSGTTWINGDVVMSDRSSCCGMCRLEPTADGTSLATRTATQSPGGPIRLEGSDRMVILLRVVDRKVDRLRVFSEDCQLDAGNRPVRWLENVRAADSIALLEAYATETGPDHHTRVTDSAVSAIALHGDPAADQALDRLAAVSQPDAIRRRVTFWLGNTRGRHGLDTLNRMLREDPSLDVRRSAVNGLAQSKEPQAFDALVALVRNDKVDRIRSEAVFWIGQKGDDRAVRIITETLEKDPATEVRRRAVFALAQLKDDRGIPALIQIAKTHELASMRAEALVQLAQKAGKRAEDTIKDRLDQDPDTEVKKRAVFALSQLPQAEGVPLLITVARTNPNREVRKQAMFWLGQSKDPRAIAFFEEILK